MRAAALRVVAHRAVQAGGGLEPDLAVERRVDARCDGGGVGDQVVVDVAEAELEAVVGRGHLVDRGEPRGGRRTRHLDVEGYADLRGARGRVDAADVADRVVDVTDGDLHGRHLEAQACGGAERAGELAGPAGDHHGQGPREAAHERQVGVAEDEAGHQVGVPLLAACPERRGGVVESGVAGGEDRRVVDEGAPEVWPRSVGSGGCALGCHGSTLTTR